MDNFLRKGKTQSVRYMFNNPQRFVEQGVLYGPGECKREYRLVYRFGTLHNTTAMKTVCAVIDGDAHTNA